MSNCVRRPENRLLCVVCVFLLAAKPGGSHQRRLGRQRHEQLLVPNLLLRVGGTARAIALRHWRLGVTSGTASRAALLAEAVANDAREPVGVRVAAGEQRHEFVGGHQTREWTRGEQFACAAKSECEAHQPVRIGRTNQRETHLLRAENSSCSVNVEALYTGNSVKLSIQYFQYI